MISPAEQQILSTHNCFLKKFLTIPSLINMLLYRRLQVWKINISPVETFHGKNTCSVLQFKFPPKWRKMSRWKTNAAVKGAVLCAGNREVKKVTHFYTLMMHFSASWREKKDRTRKRQIFGTSQFKYHILIPICTNVCSGEQDFSDLSPSAPTSGLQTYQQIMSVISWAPAEPKQLLLSSSAGATRKDRNRETPYGFLDAHLFQLSSIPCNSVFYWFTVVLIFLYFSPFCLI